MMQTSHISSADHKIQHADSSLTYLQREERCCNNFYNTGSKGHDQQNKWAKSEQFYRKQGLGLLLEQQVSVKHTKIP